jgi:hypothetical protein
MSSNVANRSPFLRTSREFPEDLENLTRECNKSYIDIALNVNQKSIGLFTTNKASQNGESWFITAGRQQQGFRQVFNIGAIASFNHGLNWSSIQFITRLWAIGYDGTSYYPIPYVNATDATANIGISINSTQVVFTTGADSPSITSTLVIIEWISNV